MNVRDFITIKLKICQCSFVLQSNIHQELSSKDKNHHSNVAVPQQGNTMLSSAISGLVLIFNLVI